MLPRVRGFSLPVVLLAPLTLALLALAAAPAPAQDWHLLERPGRLGPESNLVPQSLPAGTAVVRVLLAGDSWAQFMWDDGSHNDIFDRYGQADKLALSNSLDTNPGPGYTGSAYAVSGSEARNWTDPANYPYMANLVNALNANPSVDLVMLSIGGNDVLAGKSDGGWYKDMDLDVPGSEAAFFDQLHTDTESIISSIEAVRPDIRVMISSYDYPNFNISNSLFCAQYACPERQNLSRDPTNDLITDQEINAMMVQVETYRIGWANADTRVEFDNSIGLMHYFYGDGVTGPLLLPRPGTVPPDYLPFPGGNPLLPTLRSNFRLVYFLGFYVDADPIHLNYDGYQRKIAQQTEAVFFPTFRGDALATITSQGGANDGWTDGTSIGTTGIQIGDNGPGLLYGIVSFDTSSLPDGATVTGARFYLTRSSAVGTSPFQSGALGLPRVDVTSGSFGAPAVEPADAVAPADAPDAGYVAGSAKADGYAVGVQIDAAGLAAINTQGLTQFRISFPTTGGSSGSDAVTFYDGDAATLPATFASLAQYMGSAQPFLDVSYTVQTGVADAGPTGPHLLANSPNPFRSSTSIRFVLPREGEVTLRIVDVRGAVVRTVQDGFMTAGGHAVTWDGRTTSGVRAAAGFYLAVLDTPQGRSTRRMVRLD